MGHIGHEVPPGILQLAQLGDIVQDNQRSQGHTLGVPQGGAVGFEDFPPVVLDLHFPFNRFRIRQRAVNEPF